MKVNETPAQQQTANETSGFDGPEAAQLMSSYAGLAAGPGTPQLRQLQAAADASPQVGQLRAIQLAANNSAQVRQAAQLQRAADGLQAAPLQRQENKTGMPDALKSGVESLSGMDMSDVRVHYNSSKPAGLDALAYAQGNDIHMGPGQEQHLAHEAWHVVQQRQGRVQPTTETGGQAINDDKGLEREADVMGAKALQTKADPAKQLKAAPASAGSAQLVAQLLKEGNDLATSKNKKTAGEELDQIDDPSKVNDAMVEVESLANGTFTRYKTEYGHYLASKGDEDLFQWPLTYLKGRASRKNGRLAETPSIQSVYGDSVGKNNKSYDVEFDSLYGGTTITVIPDIVTDDVIADVKDVKYQSFTEQLEGLYAIAKGHDSRGGDVEVTCGGDTVTDFPRRFELVVRGPKTSKDRTQLSSQLLDALDAVHYVIV